jgi:hypothetical protein
MFQATGEKKNGAAQEAPRTKHQNSNKLQAQMK